MQLILGHIENIYQLGYNPILILDIDDTVLSSQYGKKLVDKDVVHLIRFIDNISSNNLWFLTARDYEYHRKTLHHLNHAKLLHKQEYILYNIMHSPHDCDDDPTKGETLINRLIPRIEISSPNQGEKNYYIIVDDDIEQVNNMLQQLVLQDYSYSLFHFTT
jgi:hypothetical protein